MPMFNQSDWTNNRNKMETHTHTQNCVIEGVNRFSKLFRFSLNGNSVKQQIFFFIFDTINEHKVCL